jgi:hypothetical protein
MVRIDQRPRDARGRFVSYSTTATSASATPPVRRASRRSRPIGPPTYSPELLVTLGSLAHTDVVAQALLDPLYTTNAEADFLALDLAAASFTFLPANRCPTPEEDPLRTRGWDCRGRQTARIGRVVGMVLRAEGVSIYGIRDHHVESFVRRLRNPQAEGREIVVVRGDDVVKYYRSAHSKGGLRSCMTDSANTKFYARRPDQVGLLIVRDPKDDRITARRLYWSSVHGPVGDRIYCAGFDAPALTEYVLAHDGYSKMERHYLKRNGETGETRRGALHTRVHFPDGVASSYAMGGWPVLDTFGFPRPSPYGDLPIDLYNNSQYRDSGFGTKEGVR